MSNLVVWGFEFPRLLEDVAMTAQPPSAHRLRTNRKFSLNLGASKITRLLTAFAIVFLTLAILMTSVMAQNIGVSLAYSDDLFLTTLREAMEKRAKELGVKIQFEHAQGDIGKQLSQIQNFAAQKMNAIIVNPGRRSPPMPAFLWFT